MKQSLDNVDSATGLLKGSFGIGTYEKDSRVFPALVRAGGDGLDLSQHFHDTHAILDDWPRNFDRLVDLEAVGGADFHFSEARALPPLTHPNVLAAGANYRQHVAEMLTKNKFNQHNRLPEESDEDFFRRNYAIVERRAREGMPFLWTGLHSSLVGAGENVILPVLGSEPDWELELGVIVGRTGRYRSCEQALEMVAGYVIVNDLGTVDIFRRSDVPWGYDWISKHQPTFKVAGPFMVPAAFIQLNDDVRIRLKVNGQVRQDWPVTDMIFGIPQLLAYASERIRLMPGDLLLTGSPPGNGKHWGRFLQDGDVIDSDISFLGRQRNLCKAEQRPEHPLAFGLWKDS